MKEKTTIEALNYIGISEQTLKAAQILLPTYDLDPNEKPLYKDQPRLGYPTAILICCFIESLGHVVLNKKDNEAFRILYHKDYFNLGLDENQCKWLYQNFRNKLCHNMVLPIGFLLDCNPTNESVFDFDRNTKRITKVNLYNLLNLAIKALDHFKTTADIQNTTNYLNEAQNLAEKIISPNAYLRGMCLSPSGVCYLGLATQAEKKKIQVIPKRKFGGKSEYIPSKRG